jgi:hypothetical protein
MQFTCNIIEGKYLHITYYACIACTIGLVIENIGKLKWVNIIAKEVFLNIKTNLYKIQELFRG